jgi:hypothetical protein
MYLLQVKQKDSNPICCKAEIMNLGSFKSLCMRQPSLILSILPVFSALTVTRMILANFKVFKYHIFHIVFPSLTN